MNFLNYYKEMEKKICIVLLCNSLQSETDFKNRLMSTQQNGNNSYYCHFQNAEIFFSSDIYLILDDMREQGLISMDNINLNERGKERIDSLYEDEQGILLAEDNPNYPAEIKREFEIGANKFNFISDVNKDTYDLIWSIPLLFDFYALFNYTPRENYLSLVIENSKKTAFCIDSGSLIFRTKLEVEKRNLEKNYSALCGFYFMITKKSDFSEVIKDFTTFLFSSGLRFTISKYILDNFEPIFGNTVREIAQKDEQNDKHSFTRYSLEHSILKDWSRGKLHELYFYRILYQCNFFDFLIPCVTSIKINNIRYSDFKESDIIAIKDSKIYLFELKRTNSLNSVKKGLAQIQNHINFFKNQGFECEGFLVTLGDKGHYTMKGNKIKNISPANIRKIIEIEKFVL